MICNPKFPGMTVIGHLGQGNAGDDAILLSFLSYLDGLFRYPTRLYLYAPGQYLGNSLPTFEKLRINFVFSHVALARAIFYSQYVVLNGGDYLDDFGSLSKRVTTYLRFWVVAFLVYLTRRCFLLVNTGIRVHSTLGLVMTKAVLNFVKRISVRDSNSLKTVERISDCPASLGFDTAILLPRYDKRQNIDERLDYEIHEHQFKRLGISITPYFSNFFDKPQNDFLFAEMIAGALNSIMKEYENIEVVFLSFNMNKDYGDVSIIKIIMNILSPSHSKRSSILHYKGDMHRFLEGIESLDRIMCCKYHSIIFSYMLSKPILVLSYHPKCSAIAHDLGLSADLVYSIDDVFRIGFNSRILESVERISRPQTTLNLPNARKKARDGIRWCLGVYEK